MGELLKQGQTVKAGARINFAGPLGEIRSGR